MRSRSRDAQAGGRSRRALTGMSILTGLLAAWLWVVVDHVAQPEVDPRQEVDAVYVLGPVETRIEQTLAVMDSGIAPVLLATTSIHRETGESYATDHCGLVTDRYRVECVVPEPYNTRGEAAALAAAVEENGWERVAVITSTPHTARARMLMERCVDADILMWPVGRDERRSWSSWLGSFVYESGAWVKTQVVKEC